MKKLALATVLSLSTAGSLTVNAESKTMNETRRASIFSITTIAGAALGGPVGMMAGFIGGALMAEQSKKNFEERENMALEIVELESDLGALSTQVAVMEDSVAKKLEFQVMFTTGKDTLSKQDLARIDSLASYLKKNPHLNVRLDGHADPRGTDEYNNVLSKERAKSVATALTEKGVSESIIDIYAHGASLAMETEASRDGYALERRVHIEVYNGNDSDIASNH